MPRDFPRTEPAWGLRAYLVLLGAAARRETITYEQLSERIDRGGARFLHAPLMHLMRWCENQGLPPLTVLVVNKTSGRPERGLTTIDPEEFAEAQQRVFALDWFAVLPPTIDELSL